MLVPEVLQGRGSARPPPRVTPKRLQSVEKSERMSPVPMAPGANPTARTALDRRPRVKPRPPNSGSDPKREGVEPEVPRGSDAPPRGAVLWFGV